MLRLYRSLLAIMMWLIYFPIVALNIAYAILAGEFALSAANNPDIKLDTPADQHVAVASIVGIFAFFGLALARNLGSYFQAISTLVIACLLGIGAFALVNTLTAARVFTYGQYAILFNEGLNLLWVVVIAGSLIYLLSIPVLCLFFYRRWRSILLGFTTQFLVVRFWLALITTVWLVYLTSIFDNRTYDSLISEIGGPIRFISLLWFDVAVVGIVLVSSLAAYVLQTARNRGRKSGQTYPRLIVPSILPYVSIALAIAGVSIIAACNCPMVLEQCEPVTCDLVYKPSEWIIANAATLLAIGGVVIQFAHGRFDVAIDIVNFFKSNRGHRRFNPLSGGRIGFPLCARRLFGVSPTIETATGRTRRRSDCGARSVQAHHLCRSQSRVDDCDRRFGGGP